MEFAATNDLWLEVERAKGAGIIKSRYNLRGTAFRYAGIAFRLH
jgi:hypothetical protein